MRIQLRQDQVDGAVCRQVSCSCEVKRQVRVVVVPHRAPITNTLKTIVQKTGWIPFMFCCLARNVWLLSFLFFLHYPPVWSCEIFCLFFISTYLFVHDTQVTHIATYTCSVYMLYIGNINTKLCNIVGCFMIKIPWFWPLENQILIILAHFQNVLKMSLKSICFKFFEL